jgi:glutaconate CoA-transferase subunit B
MVLTGLYPGVTVDDVKTNVGWPLKARDRLGQVARPSVEELRLLRDVLDPKKLYLG